MKNFLLTFSILLLGYQMNAQIIMSEIRIDQPGGDDDEYFELCNNSGSNIDLSTLTYIVIGDGTGGSGVIEEVTNLTGTLIAGDCQVWAESTFTLSGCSSTQNTVSLSFENSDNVTHLLVSNFSGSVGDDLDTDDDGVLNVTPWTSIEDCVALVETVGSGDEIYCTTTIGPDGSNVPGHVYFAGGNWNIGPFDPSGGDDTPCQVNPVPQPVTLISFEAKPTNNKSITLTWQTASEENNDYFSIEHSTDGTSFREIATQAGNGTTTIVQDYSFLHKDVENGLHYYRLKQVDFDGKFENSNIVTVKVSHSNDDIFLTPNPTSNVILIQTKTPFEKDADFQILNMRGQVVLSSVLQEGAANIEVNISDFPVGIYYLQLFVDNDVMMKKVIKH